MSAGRYEIFDDGPCIRIVSPDSTISTIVGRPVGYHIDDAVIGAIRQQARDLDQLRAECDILTHKVICCGVAAWHSDPLLTTTGAYAGKWNSPQADCVRKLRAERDQLRADLAAAVAENAALLAANRDCILHFDAIKADYDVMKLRAEQAEARLAAIDGAPTVAMLCPLTESAFNESTLMTAYQKAKMPHVELIARPAKD